MSFLPPAPPTYSDPNLTASRFLNNPTFVARRMQTLGDLRYIGNLLLPGRQVTSGGAVGYESVEGITADKVPEIVSPGAEYTLTTTGDGAASLALVTKWGQDSLVTDEAVKRRNMDPVNKGLLKLVNSAGIAIDGSVLTVISSAVTQTRAAAAAWSTNPATVLQDILRAAADIRANNLGYEPDTLVVSDATWAYLASNSTIATAMARETAQSTVNTGRFQHLLGMRVINVPQANLPGGTNQAWVLDSSQLGFIAVEDLGGGYQSAGDLVESKVMREDATDSWRIRARATFVPVVTDPGAGFKISGV